MHKYGIQQRNLPFTLLHIEGWKNLVKTTRKNKFQMRRFLIKLRSPFYKEIIFEAVEKKLQIGCKLKRTET